MLGIGGTVVPEHTGKAFGSTDGMPNTGGCATTLVGLLTTLATGGRGGTNGGGQTVGGG